MNLLPTNLAAMALGIQPSTLRSWASLGLVTRHGSRQRATYDVGELKGIAAAIERGEWHPRSRFTSRRVAA